MTKDAQQEKKSRHDVVRQTTMETHSLIVRVCQGPNQDALI